MFSACEFSQSGCGKEFGAAYVDSGGAHSVSHDKAPSTFATADTDQGASAVELKYFNGCNSFAGATLVLMADGSAEPISEVKPGDSVRNTLPDAGPGSADQSHEVTAVHVTKSDREYVDVTIDVGHGMFTVVGTAHHLYWDATSRAWVTASELAVGHELQTDTGGRGVIVALNSHSGRMTTYNLTVDGVHTYYVLGDAGSILVHNDCTISIYRTPKIVDMDYERANGPNLAYSPTRRPGVHSLALPATIGNVSDLRAAPFWCPRFGGIRAGQRVSDGAL
jgi:hypothetical protein